MDSLKNFLKKVSYAISSNLVRTLLSVLTTFIVPIFLNDDVTQYGYFQIYSFYVSYVGFFHLGWCDGVFLRDGGKRYEDLDKGLYSSQFWLLTLFEFIISIIVVIVGSVQNLNLDYQYIYMTVAANIFVLLPRTMLEYYLQTTNRIKEYASITITGRIIYSLCLILVFVEGLRNYKFFVLGDLIGKIVALFVAIWWCRDIVFSKPVALKVGLEEAKTNIKVGINLMFANIASFLITGIVRIGIQTKWDVATYGKISFALNVSSLLLIFISAVSMVLYPTLRRTDKKRLPQYYGILRNILMLPLLGLLVLYYPVKEILSIFLPQYADSMKYMAILFPICIYSAKMNMLIQTYMNVFRLEKKILRVNIYGVIVAFITTAISVFVLENLTFAMISIVINQMFRCIYAELTLSKVINISVKKDICYEMVMTVFFISVSWFVGGWLGVILYLLAYVLYCFIKKSEVIELVRYIGRMRKAQ